eukprot:3636250-Pyramimonas_sp.AAC.1
MLTGLDQHLLNGAICIIQLIPEEGSSGKPNILASKYLITLANTRHIVDVKDRLCISTPRSRGADRG